MPKCVATKMPHSVDGGDRGPRMMDVSTTILQYTLRSVLVMIGSIPFQFCSG